MQTALSLACGHTGGVPGRHSQFCSFHGYGALASIYFHARNCQEMDRCVTAEVRYPDDVHNPADIARQIMCGNRNAEVSFARRFRKPVLELLEQMSGDQNLAEDLAHDTIITVIANLRENRLDDPTRLPGYTYAIARNLLLAWRRKMSTREITGASLDELPQTGLTPESEYFRTLHRAALRRSIETLAIPRDREILLRHYLQDQSKREVCEALRLTSDQFDRVICRARMRLQSWILEVAPTLAREVPA